MAEEFPNKQTDTKFKLFTIHEIGCISTNYGPILKIRKLAYSAEQARPAIP